MRCGKCTLCTGVLLLLLFAIWTGLIQNIDLQVVGETGRTVGFATMNGWIHRQIGVNLLLYSITDWLGFVPVGVGMLFGGLGVAQLIQRKSLLKVDRDILLLGGYYLLVIVLYLAFERLPINYRPVFIENRLEASYPSSTTLLVLSVMPTLVFHVNRRWKTIKGRRAVTVTSVMFSLFMVIGRLLSGVHWFSDILGSVLLSMGLFYLYKATVLLWDKRKN